MDEHDDDSESEVQEGTGDETDGYPVTGDELDEPAQTRQTPTTRI